MKQEVFSLGKKNKHRTLIKIAILIILATGQYDKIKNIYG